MFQASNLSGGVAEIEIDNPPVNAFSIGFLHDLAATIERLGADETVHAILIRAKGKGFCGGGDVKEVQALPAFEGILGQAEGSQRAVLAVLRCAVPVIVAVHGYAVGVGVLLAGAADILLAAEGTRFVLAEIDNGATAGGILAAKLMPEKRVRAAMMTAEPVFAEELHRYGSIYRLAPEADLREVARGIATTVAGKPAKAMRKLKKSLNNSLRTHEVEAAYRAELSYTYELNISGVAAAGREAFLSGERASYLRDQE
jgi:enoyl-CoA hydratase